MSFLAIILITVLVVAVLALATVGVALRLAFGLIKLVLLIFLLPFGLLLGLRPRGRRLRVF